MRPFGLHSSDAEGSLDGAAAGSDPPDDLPEAANVPQGIPGERGPASVDRARSLQSHVSNLLAAGLMTVFGVGALGWYYARRSRARASRREGSGGRSGQGGWQCTLAAAGCVPASGCRAGRRWGCASARFAALWAAVGTAGSGRFCRSR